MVAKPATTYSYVIEYSKSTAKPEPPSEKIVKDDPTSY
jgi:hypothetical protein